MATYNFDDSEYSHNFQDRIAQGEQNVAQKQGEYQQYQGRADQAYNTQQQAMDNRQSYGDILSQAKQTEGVNEAKAQYQRDTEAVNALQSAMNTLPSSINANSNVTLTNAQRQAALGNQMNKYQNSYDYATREAATSGNMYQMAQNAAFTAAEAGATEQQQNITNAMNAYGQEMQNLQNLYTQLANERQQVFNTYGQMYEDEYQHMQEQLQLYANNLQAETQRYIADQEDATKRWMQERQNENNITIQQMKNEAEKYAADAGMRVQQYLQGLNKQNGTGGNDYLSFLNSEAALNAPGWESDMSDEEKKYWLMRNAQDYQRYMSTGDLQGLRNLTSGDTYQSYLNWRNQ